MLPFDHWSYSKLSTYLRCPAQFYFRYIEQAPAEETSAAMILGTAFHQAVTLFHSRRTQGNPATQEEILQSMRDQLTLALQHSEAPVTFPTGHPDQTSTVQLGLRLMDTYLQEHSPRTVIALEQELTAPLQKRDGEGSQLPLLGYIDRVDQDATGIIAVEVKTAARAWTELEARFSDQVSSYGLLLRAAGYQNVRFQFEVVTKTKVAKLQILETARTDEDLDRLVVRFLHVERGVMAGAFPRNQDTQNCSGCPYKLRCGSTWAI